MIRYAATCKVVEPPFLIAYGHVTVGLHKKSINGVQQRVPCSSSHAKANEIDFCDQALAMDPESLKLLSEGPVWLIKLFVCNTENLTMQFYHLYI